MDDGEYAGRLEGIHKAWREESVRVNLELARAHKALVDATEKAEKRWEAAYKARNDAINELNKEYRGCAGCEYGPGFTKGACLECVDRSNWRAKA